MGVVLTFFLVALPRPHLKGPRQPRYTGNGKEEQAMFRAPFLAPSSCHGGEQCIPKEECSATQTAAKLLYCSRSKESDPIA